MTEEKTATGADCEAPMTGVQYLLNRIAELEFAVATLIDQKAAVEKECQELKAAERARRGTP